MLHNNAFMNLVEDAKTRIQEVSIAALTQMQEEGSALFIVDVREDAEWAQGSLPDAIHLSKGLLEYLVEQVILDKTARIVLYCGGGYRSALAADNLQKMGYSNVFSLIGGYKAWAEK